MTGLQARDHDDEAKWTALGSALAEVERMQFWRSRGQETGRRG